MATLNPLLGIPPEPVNPFSPQQAAPQAQPNGFNSFLAGDGFGNILTALGASLMSSPRNAPLSNFADTLNTAQTMTLRQRQAEQEAAEREEDRRRKLMMAQALKPILPANLQALADADPESALALYEQMNPEATANMREFQYAKEQGYEGTFADWVNSGGAGGGVLGTTIYTGRDANGNIVPLQVGSDGSFHRTTLPEDISFDPGALNAERAYGNEVGKGRGQAEVQAPEAIATAQRTLTQIQQLKQDPGLWWSVGGMGWTPNVPGNPQAGTISRIEQLQGAAFLEAFETLKGGGQITEVEGTKATNAIARLQRSQNYDDFVRALTDLEEIVAIGLERAQRQAQGGAPVPALGGGNNASTPSASGGGFTILSVE